MTFIRVISFEQFADVVWIAEPGEREAPHLSRSPSGDEVALLGQSEGVVPTGKATDMGEYGRQVSAAFRRHVLQDGPAIAFRRAAIGSDSDCNLVRPVHSSRGQDREKVIGVGEVRRGENLFSLWKEFFFFF
jgi:hypothetical protein